MSRSVVRSENTLAIDGHMGIRPDILITAAGRVSVVIEADNLTTSTAEPEAKSRLGLKWPQGLAHRGHQIK